MALQFPIKKYFLLFGLVLTTASAIAFDLSVNSGTDDHGGDYRGAFKGDYRGGYGGNYGGGGYGGGRDIQCRAYDVGWEEHRPHNSCRECLSYHGRCEMRCYQEIYSCTVTGVVRDRDGSGGRTERFTAEGSTEYEAKQKARDYCYRYASDCSTPTCTHESNLVDEYSCRGRR